MKRLLRTAKPLGVVLTGGMLLLSASTCDAQIFHKKKKINKSTSPENNAQPDKLLYDKAMGDIKHGRQEVGRLNMQTLINTYPDSEYLAKAKLAIADSYYKEGGSANLALAISGYKDFIVFFPFLPEARYAQMQVAMAHYRQMEKPDRDRSQATAAEEEFQTFLQKYPSDPLTPAAEQRLREVQEVLAEGDYRIGYFYYVKGDNRAAAARLMTVTKRYPLYSRSDRALWMLGDIFVKSEHKEVATLFYSKIVRNYPLSPLVPSAKNKLKAFGAPVPQPDPEAVAWMRVEQNAPRKHTSALKKPLGLFKNGPGYEVQMAAKTGKPNLEPEETTTSATDILTAGGQSSVGGTSAGGTGIVATVTPGTTSGATGSAETTTPADSSTANPPAATEQKDPPATPDPTPATAATTGSAATNTAPAATGSDATTGAAPAGTEAKSDTAASGTPNGDNAKASDSQNGTQKGEDSKKKKESSSKKKKGLRKVIPW